MRVAMLAAVVWEIGIVGVNVGSARAGGHPRSPDLIQGRTEGIRISRMQVDPLALSADFDVTEWKYPSYSYNSAFLGVATDAGNQFRPAIDFGDGSSVAANYLSGNATGIPLYGTASFQTIHGATRPFKVMRGSFSHVYPQAGDYQVNAWAVCCAAGSTVTGNTQHLVVTSGGGGPSFTVTDLVAVAQVRLIPSNEIPVLSSAGLVAFGLLLSGAGLLLLRRAVRGTNSAA